ncbi:TPA: HIRAN domain-containing protein, partial [Streptococcus pyogenes]
LTGRGGQYKTLKNDLKTVVTKKKDITYKLRLTILKVDRVSKSKNAGLLESIASWFLN